MQRRKKEKLILGSLVGLEVFSKQSLQYFNILEQTPHQCASKEKLSDSLKTMEKANSKRYDAGKWVKSRYSKRED